MEHARDVEYVTDARVVRAGASSHKLRHARKVFDFNSSCSGGFSLRTGSQNSIANCVRKTLDSTCLVLKLKMNSALSCNGNPHTVFVEISSLNPMTNVTECPSTFYGARYVITAEIMTHSDSSSIPPMI
jgi:hypothetical protein